MIKSLKPQLETVFNEAATIAPVERSSYPLIQKIPDGTELKELPNGNTAVKRPKTKKAPSTLELQSSKDKKLKIKVRYL